MRNLILNNFKIINKLNFSTSQEIRVENFVKKWKLQFQSEKVEESTEFILRNLISHILKKDFNEIPDEIHKIELSNDQLNDLEMLCEARKARVPLQYILGEWDFRNLTIKMLPTVFIPRPETEVLIDIILKHLEVKTKRFEFLEIGSGTGAISLSLLQELENSTCIALDRSKLACALTIENSLKLNLQNRIKVFDHLVEKEYLLPRQIENQKFDFIVSNPPYIKTSLLQSLQPEIYLYENLNALDGGPDGLKIARLLLELAEKNLKFGGKLYMELDSSHPELIKKIIEIKYENSLEFVVSHKDCFNQERFVEIVRKS